MTETVRQNSYWRNRVELEQRAAIKRDEDYATELKKMHDYYFNEIDKEIRTFINRYAEKNGNIPYSEVIARLDAMDVAAFAEKAKRYVEEKDFGAIANRELAIYNLKMRVSRLEALQQELDLQMIALANEEEKKTGDFLKEEYLQGLKSQAGILGVSEGATVSTAMKQAIDRNFNGATWSSRIWDRQNALRDIVKKATADLLILGKNPTQIISKLRKEFGVSAHQAKRLAVTEGSRVAMAAQKDSLESQGYDEYEYITEPSACKICAPLEGKIFKVENMESGVNCAPMHPFCRCSVAAHYSGEKKESKSESKYDHMDDAYSDYFDGRDHEPNISIESFVIAEGIRYLVDGHKVVSDHTASEFKTANWLSRKTGKQVKIIPRINEPEGINTPDFLIDSEPWDLKEMTGSGKNLIDGNSKKAKKQAPNIIFDALQSDLSDKELLGQLEDVYKYGRRGLEKAILKSGDRIIAVVKNKKR